MIVFKQSLYKWGILRDIVITSLENANNCLSSECAKS